MVSENEHVYQREKEHTRHPLRVSISTIAIAIAVAVAFTACTPASGQGPEAICYTDEALGAAAAAIDAVVTINVAITPVMTRRLLLVLVSTNLSRALSRIYCWWYWKVSPIPVRLLSRRRRLLESAVVSREVVQT
ncbi:hypothetical protein FRC19_008070 [Serendipita sp. 401]|nr:hypothetical protein FRC19_008070 [Serendipita sp. 401]KAG9019384.1 hypothetical protein FS842_007864 [Serendipita sp. 407]